MSRAKPAAERIALDSYQTPAALAEAACATLARLVDEPGHIIEPSAGQGAFVRAARACWPKAHIAAIDVDPKHHGAAIECGADEAWTGDWPALSVSLRHLPRPTPRLVVGNPPFREAAEHVEAGLSVLTPGEHLAFLLRLNLLGSSSRLGFWKRTPLYAVLPVIPRPSFTGSGSDATEYAVFVWRKGFQGAPRILPPIVWREKGKRAS